jgi:hypothetical protein
MHYLNTIQVKLYTPMGAKVVPRKV